jgi:hypothetical protein
LIQQFLFLSLLNLHAAAILILLIEHCVVYFHWSTYFSAG